MKWLKTYSRLIWWVAMVLFFSLVTMELWRPTFYGDFRYIKGNGIILFLVWIALLLWPLFKEINLFGLSLKKEIDSLRLEVKEQRLEFREQIVSLKSDIRIQNTVLIPPFAESVKSTTGVSKTPLTWEPCTSRKKRQRYYLLYGSTNSSMTLNFGDSL